jgi:hypothetical protein
MISVARSFRRKEWKDYLEQAGVKAGVHWRLAFRLCVST